MHEFSLAQKILEAVKEEVVSRNVTKIGRIKVNIDKVLFINNHSIQEAFDLVSQGSVAQGAKLEVNQTDGLGQVEVKEIEAELAD